MITIHDVFSPYKFAQNLWQKSDFPDLRLFRRAIETVSMWIERAQCPDAKIPRKKRRAAQRFIRNERISTDTLAEKGSLFVARLVAELPLLLVAHDSVETAFKGRYQPNDSGPLRSSNSKGYMVHNSFAIDPEKGWLLGMLISRVWKRSWKMKHQNHKLRKFRYKESFKWIRGIRQVIKLLKKIGFKGRIVHIADAEADVHENYEYAQKEKISIVIRATKDRRIIEDSGKLWAYLSKQSIDTYWESTIRTSPSKLALEQAHEQAKQSAREHVERKAEKQRKSDIEHGMTPKEAEKRSKKIIARILRQKGEQAEAKIRAEVAKLGEQRPIKLEVRYASITLNPNKRNRKPVRLNAVYLKEVAPPKYVNPVDWMILTTVELKSADDAVTICRWYRSRFGIEEVHKVLKTGLRMEQEPFDTIKSFKRFLAVAGPVATQIVRWRDASRSDPQNLATDYVDPSDLEMLKEACRYHKYRLPRRNWTLKDFVLRLALLGGYEERKGRQPGWLVIWRGWRELQDFRGIYNFVKSQENSDEKKCVPP
jgi:hypothetical protein